MYIYDERFSPAKRSATEAKEIAESIGDGDTAEVAERYLEAIATATLYTEHFEEPADAWHQASYQAPSNGANKLGYRGKGGGSGKGSAAPKSRPFNAASQPAKKEEAKNVPLF